MKQSNKPYCLRRADGFSLIELLIAMALGLTLAAGVMQIYAGISTAGWDQNARLRIQENGRFALNVISSEIRMAGYLGCLGSMEGSAANNTLDGPPATLQPGTGIQGWEAAGTAPGEINNSIDNVETVASTSGEWATSPAGAGFRIPNVQAVPNSDLIRLWSGAGAAGAVSAVDNSGADPVIQAEAASGIRTGDFLIISDCEQVDFVQACTVTPTGGGATTVDVIIGSTCSPGNTATATVTSAAPAEVIRLQGSFYYAGKRNNAAGNTPSLFRAVLDTDGTAAAGEEIIEGVESMQLLYGVNTDRDVRATVDAYLTADNVTDWDQVVSVQVSLLMLSVEEGMVPSPRQYTFGGVVYDGAGGNGDLPGDHRLRRVFTSTVSIRNRALGG